LGWAAFSPFSRVGLSNQSDLAGARCPFAFPPDIASAVPDIGENVSFFIERIAFVRIEVRSGNNSKVSSFRVDGEKPAIRTRLHPGDIVPDRPNLPTSKRLGGINIAKFVFRKRWERRRNVGFRPRILDSRMSMFAIQPSLRPR
jgi:hypothetical protein